MNKGLKLILLLLVAFAATALLGLYFHTHSIAVLNPKGIIALKERNLIYLSLALMLVVVIPVFALTIGIAWKYRADNTKADYQPDWDHSNLLEFIWWAFPMLIITVLAVVTWNSSHELDPYRALQSGVKPVTIQVVALQWKWLFIYPDQHIATVNYIQFPENTPVNFQITADAPMNSFWIPQLAGQVYAMPGMSTQLHVMASDLGSYIGVSANLSGQGFAGMQFTAKSSTRADFNDWVAQVQQSSQVLDQTMYDHLSAPSEHDGVSYYSSSDDTYNQTIMKFMMPATDIPSSFTPTFYNVAGSYQPNGSAQ